MPRHTTTPLPTEVAALVAHAALGEQVLALVKASGLAKPKRYKLRARTNGAAEPPVRRRRRRTREAISDQVKAAVRPRSTREAGEATYED